MRYEDTLGVQIPLDTLRERYNMSDIGIDLIKDMFADESGLSNLFVNSSHNDYRFELKYNKNDDLLIVVTDIDNQQIEVFRLDIIRLI
jgi:hypothetical protein